MSNLARLSLTVQALISVKDSHLIQDSDNVHYLERTAERSREECPLCSTVPLIAGHQENEVYETYHVI